MPPISLTAAYLPPQRPYMAWQKPRYLRRAMPLPSVFCTLVRSKALRMILPTFLSSKRLCPKLFAWSLGVEYNRPLDGERILDPVASTRCRCLGAFRRTNLLAKLIPTIEDVLSAGGLNVPVAPEEAQSVAFTNDPGIGDAGHRT